MSVTYRDTGVTYRSTLVTYRGETPSPFPTLLVDVAFSNNPTDSSPTWVDISDYVESVTTRRGRQHELDRFETGTATVLLDNNDRRFDPSYTAGPYYGQLLPMKRIRIRARYDGVDYPVFSGLVEGWPQEYGPDGVLAFVQLPCSDLFKSLALLGLSGVFPSELTGARVTRVLDALGWPAGERDIDVGQSTVQAATLTGTSAALAHLQDVNTSENGFLFIARDGKVTFIDRHQLILATLNTALTWGDDTAGTEYPYTDITLDPGDSSLWNQVTVSAPSLTSQTGVNSASQAKYFTRSYNRSTVLTTTGQMQDLANFLVSRFAEPSLRVVGMTMDGLPPDTLPVILARELGDKIRVNRRPRNLGSTITQDSVVDGVQVSASKMRWQVTWNLSPTDSVNNYWVLGDSLQSILNTSTRLAY